MRIGKVTVLGELGAGAGSRVFLVRRAEDAREYALKVAHAGRGPTQQYLAQARNEYRIAGLFDHPNLIHIYCLESDAGWFSAARTVKLLAEYAPGRPMDLLPLQPVDALVRAFERIAAAVAHMHRRGVIHADLKPNNLILGPGTIKVIDYGVAHRAGGRRERGIDATPAFMAPETITHRLLNEKTDIYSFGATMYRLTTFLLPPPTVNAVVLGERGFERRYRPAGALNPQVPIELSDLIQACMRFDPNRRPASMEVVRKMLARIGEQQKAPNPHG
jgi:serine/threonine protein kinase